MDQPRAEKTTQEKPDFPRKPRILVAPLDWGLGHATRCIPLIRALIAAGAEVWIGAENSIETLLRMEFPQLSFIPLPGYRVRYSRSGSGLFARMLVQAPSILKAIRSENAWLKKMMNEKKFDAVIADNRFGLSHPDIPCVFMTHQLVIKSPSGKLLEGFLRKKNYRYINRFSECWIPDQAGDNNLAGELSHPTRKPDIPLRYIGWLSRFSSSSKLEREGHVLVIISGPEPQRTLFENKIIREISQYPATATIVRGLPGSAPLIPSTSMLHFYNHLPTEELNKEIASAEYVIARSGYSTIMDIVSLGKKSILVPTPGQSEQIYLGNYLTEKNIALSIPMNQFSIQSGLNKAKGFRYVIATPPVNDLLDKAINSLFSLALAGKKEKW